MGSASIGIKLADSKFFPILDEGAPVSRILDLTTVRDDQTSVQINLFRSEDGSIDSATYVGTLIIEDIVARPAGEPTVELTLTLDDMNELSAEAVDLDSGTRQALSVSLETLDNEELYNLPDFDLTPMESSLHLGDDPEHRNVVLEATIPGNAPEGLYEMNSDEKKNGIFMPAWLCVVILVMGVLALVLALLVSARVMMLNRSMQQVAEAQPVAVTAPAVPAVEPAPVPEVQPEVVTPPPVETVSEEPPVAKVVEEPAPAPEPPAPAPEAKAIRYKIKWGDTLWDIADAYYRNPWLYKKIAKHNKIRNPNLIIAGNRLEIPPK